MKKIIYEIEVLSSLIISPRSGQAFYKGIDEFCSYPKIETSNSEKIQEAHVIYPFYQYGEYEKYDPNHANYYIPGSSIKGALCLPENMRNQIMTDDMIVPNDKIVLRNLWKAQYLEDKEEAKMAAFFENVGVEMVKSGTRLEGELYLDDLLQFSEILNQSGKKVKAKIKQMCGYFRKILGEQYNNTELNSSVKNAQKQLELFLKEENIYLLGGYKGLLHSILLKENEKAEELKSSIFLDLESGLPHGFIKVKNWR